MLSKVSQSLTNISDGRDSRALAPVFATLAYEVNTCALSTAGLVITGAAGTTAKIGAAAFYATAGGRLLTIAASTVMPALTGLVITANSFNVACFFVNAAGTVSVAFGTQGTTLGSVLFPDFALGQALVGMLVITHSATFTGGTTALDTATTVYLSPIGAFDPTLIF